MSNYFNSTYDAASAVRTTWPRKDITLSGRFINLSALEYSHTDRLWPMVSAPEITNAAFWSYLHTDPWTRYEDLERVVHSRTACQDGVFYAIVDNVSGQPHGWIGLRHIDLPAGKGELGIFLPSPSIQRTAVSTEAVFLLLEYAFDSLGFDSVEWSTDARNEASRRAAERVGFELDRDAGYGWGQVNMMSYRLLQSEWSRVKEAMELWLLPQNFDERGVQRQRLGDIKQGLATATSWLGRA